MVLFYDGLCGFCDRTVQFVLERDAGGSMRFAPLQGIFASEILLQHPELRGTDSLVLVERRGASGETRITTRSDAILKVAAYLGGPWRAVRLLRLLPRPLRDWGYDRFAASRYRLFGRLDSCRIPAPEARARFID